MTKPKATARDKKRWHYLLSRVTDKADKLDKCQRAFLQALEETREAGAERDKASLELRRAEKALTDHAKSKEWELT